jgi:hypothetical protein
MGGSTRIRRRLAAAAVAAAALLLVPAASDAQAAVTLSASAAPKEIVFGGSTTISGQLSGAVTPAGHAIELQASPYPYTAAFQTVGTATTGVDGSYSVAGVKPDLNTRYRAVSVEPTASARSPDLPVTVDEKLLTRIRYLPLGRARLTVSSAHPTDLAWGGRNAYWFVAQGSPRFKVVRQTRTTQDSKGVTHLSADFAVPAGRFRYLVCFTAPNLLAMGPAAAHSTCHRHDFTRKAALPPPLTATFLGGRGSGPVGFPFASRIASARRYLAGRSGYTAFAVVDSQGRVSGVNVHRRFVTASVVKAMLLCAYLRKLAAAHRGLDSGSRSILYPMIHVSDNNAASAVYGRVGDGGLYRLAHAAGMTDFSVSGSWGNAQLSAFDQSRYFFRINDLLPRQFRGYARGLLSGIAGFQSWGIPRVARPHGWRVFFKGGWRSTGRGQLVHQIGRLERGRTVFSLAVMTDGDPSMGYGITTIQGVTAHLLAGRAPPASHARTLGPGGG